MTLINNGHVAQVEAELSEKATVQGGDLNGIYAFLQFHFHWGADDSRGSEHTIDGRRFPAELHLVHYNTEYGSVEEAVKYKDGLAVLGIMLTISPNDNPKLKSVIDGLSSVLNDEDTTSITPFALEDLLPNNLREFFRYQGSLTTPTCAEIVVWTVFKDTISISAAQLAKFRNLLEENGLPLVDNFRPVQHLNGRTVYMGAQKPYWGYEGEFGPAQWVSDFPLCGGSRQSPINIDPLRSSPMIPSPFVFTSYDVSPSRATIMNNGHTAQVMLETSNVPTISGGGLEGKYAFLQFHFHWGADNNKGSEHTLSGNSVPAELHLVHYNTEYGSVEEAVKYKDGLAVLGIKLAISPFANPKLQSIIDGLSDIHKAGTEAAISTFPLENLLPATTNVFFRYQGSLTTPTCNEIVVWTVFALPILISNNQIEEFRMLEDKAGKLLLNTYRPVQPTNDRTVYISGSFNN